MEIARGSVGADLCVGPNTFCCGSRSRADTQVRPYAGWKVFRTTQASGAQRSVCGAGAREWAGIGAGITPKGPSTPDNPSVTAAADSSLYTREPWDGDADCHVGPAGLLAMTTAFCHSEERSDVGIRPFYDGRGFGPPRSSAPTEGLPKSQQQAGVGIGPYGTRWGAAATAQAALSEAESTERATGQIRFLPDDLRVQHGAQGSEASAKPRPCSRRGCVN